MASAFFALAVTPAAAQTAPQLDLHIEQDLTPRVTLNDLSLAFRVTVTERATGQGPEAVYRVFGVGNSGRGEETLPFECEHLRDNDPSVAKGVYHCPMFVDYGGAWEFNALVIDQISSPSGEYDDADVAPTTVARATLPFALDTDQVSTGESDEDVIQGRFFEVAMLWGHAAAAAGWVACVAALAAVAVPALGRLLSQMVVYRLQRRLDLVVKLTAAATGLVIATGTYLLLNQTAYETPFSPSGVDGVFALPYGKPYFLALAVKLGLYAVMVLGTVPLIRVARRQLRLGPSSLRTGAASSRPVGPPAPGGTLLAPAEAPMGIDEAPPEGQRPASAVASLSMALVVVGLPAILFCVTLLKYFHELVEASRG